MWRLAILWLVTSSVAEAHPPPPPDDPLDHQIATSDPPRSGRPSLEWSSWVRVGFGTRTEDDSTSPRLTAPPAARGHAATWDLALGVDLTTGIGHSGDVRVGPWLELRGLSTSGPIGGVELAIEKLPRKLDLFFYDGEGVLLLRAGANREHATGQLAYGYLAPWNLFHPVHGATRYMIGVRVVATYTRAIDDPRDFTATIGLETEPVGALRYLLGIRSWYR